MDDELRILRSARRLLDRQGWCQFEYGLYSGGARCATGAVLTVGGPSLNLDRINRLLGFGDNGWLTTWNDEPGRTKKQVLELFDAAISRLASGSEGG